MSEDQEKELRQQLKQVRAERDKAFKLLRQADKYIGMSGHKLHVQIMELIGTK